jgi:isoleucyl-tRNA synthetase
MQRYDFSKVEKEVLSHWKKNRVHQKAQEKNKGKKPFYFLDGPPYTTGRVHIGTAWNKSLKDQVLRYKRMAGFDVWDRAGYDMHGMPTEQGVQKELGLKYKEDIQKVGIAKFTTACRDFAIRNMEYMNDDFTRLGVWMDFKNAYQPIKREYIEGEWWLIKKAHENKRLYEGEKTMHWCAHCGTSLAKHELEYQNVSEDSIFLKFPVVGSEKEFLVIWTTTPWTIPYNLGVMVNPKLDYIRAKVEDEVWIVAKGLAAGVINTVADKKYKVLEEFKGHKLEGIRYTHPLYDDIKPFKELKADKLFSVVLSEEYVDLSAGSGLVHMAPGCGPEDYEVGYREGIPPFNNLSESGVFPKDMGQFSGLQAKKDDKKFIKALDMSGALIETTKVEHDYAHCWRCKNPVIYRTTRQWFFKVEDLKENMRELNKEIYWVPGYAGSRNFDSWLANLRDNGVTRQRFWGTPLPVWKCGRCGDYVVIGSVKELKKHTDKIPDDLHKPWIDEVSWKCKCGGKMRRIPDILDVWVDSGTASWNCLDFPHRKDLFDKLFPADFILEGIDQIRGWFNLLFVASMVGMQRPSFKSVYMHGFVQDSQGRKMSKSLGNYILPQEVVDKFGADTLRFYMIGGCNPGVDLNYNNEDTQSKFRNLGVLWNLHNFLMDFLDSNGINHSQLKKELEKEFGIEEKYIFSRLHSTIKKTTDAMEGYMLNEVPWLVEGLFLDLSRGYIQMVRDKATAGTETDKKVVAYTLFHVLHDTLKMLAIICPFITDKIFLNLKERFGLREESIHLYSWPKHDSKRINEELEAHMAFASTAIQAMLRGREKAQLGVRWPLREVVFATKDDGLKEAVGQLSELMKRLVNVKDIVVCERLDGVKTTVKADYNKLGPDFGELAPQVIAKIMAESPETMLGHIAREGKFTLKLEGKEVNVVKEHLIVEHKVPEPYTEVGFRYGTVYLNTSLDERLEAEGFARELMRRIQQMRKELGLKKTDLVDVYLDTSEEMQAMLKPWRNQVSDRVGAVSVTFGRQDGAAAEKEHKIKNRKVRVLLFTAKKK